MIHYEHGFITAKKHFWWTCWIGDWHNEWEKKIHDPINPTERDRQNGRTVTVALVFGMQFIIIINTNSLIHELLFSKCPPCQHNNVREFKQLTFESLLIIIIIYDNEYYGVLIPIIAWFLDWNAAFRIFFVSL